MQRKFDRIKQVGLIDCCLDKFLDSENYRHEANGLLPPLNDSSRAVSLSAPSSSLTAISKATLPPTHPCIQSEMPGLNFKIQSVCKILWSQTLFGMRILRNQI